MPVSYIMGPLSIGIDIGGTGTKFGIVDSVGNLLFSSEMSTRNHADLNAFIDELYNNLNPLPALLNMHRIFPGREFFHWQHW
jgi:glucokinase